MVDSGFAISFNVVKRHHGFSGAFRTVLFLLGPVTSDSPKIEKMKLQASLDKKQCNCNATLEKRYAVDTLNMGANQDYF